MKDNLVAKKEVKHCLVMTCLFCMNAGLIPACSLEAEKVKIEVQPKYEKQAELNALEAQSDKERSTENEEYSTTNCTIN